MRLASMMNKWISYLSKILVKCQNFVDASPPASSKFNELFQQLSSAAEYAK
jgi:hypothetical protein